MLLICAKRLTIPHFITTEKDNRIVYIHINFHRILRGYRRIAVACYMLLSTRTGRLRGEIVRKYAWCFLKTDNRLAQHLFYVWIAVTSRLVALNISRKLRDKSVYFSNVNSVLNSYIVLRKSITMTWTMLLPHNSVHLILIKITYSVNVYCKYFLTVTICTVQNSGQKFVPSSVI